jgi:hypothetical protein
VAIVDLHEFHRVVRSAHRLEDHVFSVPVVELTSCTPGRGHAAEGHAPISAATSSA